MTKPRLAAAIVAGLGILLGIGLLVGVTALVGTVWSATTSRGPGAASSPASATPAAPSPAGAQHVSLKVNPPPLYGVKNPHGTVVDAFAPADFTVRVGKPVVVTVLNYDSMPHTWTAGGLGVNEMVPSGGPHSPSKVTFTFTPKSAGAFTWQCETPCNPWSMTHMGYMEGTVTVVA
jgi:plastocyanin